MFGSTTRGKSGVASALEKDDEAASKGAKAKEDEDRGATCSDHCHDESTSREMSPQWSPSNLRTRERFALLFGIEVAPTIEDGIGSHILPTYAWSEHIIFDMLSPTIEDISQVMILNPMECLIFRGCYSKGVGFTYGEALALSDTYHRETTTWIGRRVKMHCIMHTLRDARGDLRMVRDQESARPSSAYGNSTRKVRKVDRRHLATGGGTCAVQTTILPRGFWRNNQKEGREYVWQVQETTAAKAENQVIGAGPCSLAAIDHRVCMLTVRCQRRPDRGIPWVEVTQREYHRNFMMPFTLHERISLIWRQILIARQRTGMTSLPMTRDI